MTKLGKLIQKGAPLVAVGFKDGVSRSVLQKAKKDGLNIAELRIDLFSSCDRKQILKEIQKFKNFPIIATIRSRREGGKWNLPDSERLELYRALIPKVDAVDIELSSGSIVKKVVKAAHASGKLVIISYHNFDRTPDLNFLNGLIKKAKKAGADIVKVAALAKKPEDVQRLGLLTMQNKPKNIITIAMGKKGSVSRILFPALGSLITYSSLGEALAPGQLNFSTTVDWVRKLYINS